MPRTWIFALAVVAVASVLPHHGAHAQVWPLSVRKSNVPSSDLNIAGGVGKDLYASPDTGIGQSKEWSNPTTGNSGKVTLVRDLKLRGLPCRDVRYQFNLSKPRGTRTYYLNWCRTADDTWKIVQ